MKSGIVKLIKKNPALHRAARSVYWQYRKIRANILGTGAYENYWQNRHLSAAGDWNDQGNWVMGYWGSKDHSHRNFLIEKILSYNIDSALEIGANCGPNLYLLAKADPCLRLAGIDINRPAVAAGRELFQKSGIANVDLSVGSIEDLKKIPNKSYDIVFTDAVLLYIGPDKITEAVSEALRIARKAAIFLEWHQDFGRDSGARGVFHFDHWKRDYKKLLAEFIPPASIKVIKIPEGLWPGKDWEQLGYLIEAQIPINNLGVSGENR